MVKSKSSKLQRSPYLRRRNFPGLLIALTLVVYLLRGLGILTFMPGAIILVLLLASVIGILIYGIDLTRRW